MFFNKLDDFVDIILDDFYTTSIKDNNKVKEIQKDQNFVKHQKEINELILGYINTIPQATLDEVSKNVDVVKNLVETLTKYIVIYIFVFIGEQFTTKPDIFINNVIEFTKNQVDFQLKLFNFFNSDSNHFIIKMFYMCKNILRLIKNFKLDLVKNEPFGEDTINLVNELGPDIIKNALTKVGNHQIQLHNIIKILIGLLLYRDVDKLSLYNLIEQSNVAEGDYIFIDVVETFNETINFASIESLLSKKDLQRGVAYDIVNFIEKTNNDMKKFLSLEEKINLLINAEILVPILDDFLLYHKSTEKYDKQQTEGKKKDMTKLRYIVEKIDATTELYSDMAKNDQKIKENIMKNFYANMMHRKAILRNNIEEMAIINKHRNQGKTKDVVEYFDDLMNYRKYVFVNFRDFENYGFANYFTQTVTSVRAVNFITDGPFKQTSNNYIQLRVGPSNSFGNIVGFFIPSNQKPIQCIKINDLVSVYDIVEPNEGAFETFLHLLRRSKIRKEQHKSSIFWLFDLTKDTVKITKTSGEQTSMQDDIKSIIGELYDRFITYTYYEIIEKIDKYPNITLKQLMLLLSQFERNLGLPFVSHIYKDVEKYFFTKAIPLISDDIDHDKLYGIDGDVLDLPTYTQDTTLPKQTLVIDTSLVTETGQVIATDTVKGICQHHITWDEILELRKTSHKEFLASLYAFIQKYVVLDTMNEYICRSCALYIDVSKYILEGTFDESQKFVPFSMPMDTDLEYIPEYEKYHFAIKIMDKNLEKLASSVGLNYYVGSAPTIRWRRKGIIKNTIDMVTHNNHLLSKNFKERNETKTATYGISKALSSLFIFEMENNIYQVSSKDKDQEQYKMIKRNNIIIYVVLYLMLELNDSQISSFTSDKKNLCDVKIFDAAYKNIFQGLKLRINNAGDTSMLTNYKILCYIIYMMSCRIAKHRLWYSQQSVEKNIQKMIPIIQKFIIHTCIDVLNSIIENSFVAGVNYIFEIFRVRFFSNLKTLYSNNEFYDGILNQNKGVFATAQPRPDLKIVKDDDIADFSFNEVEWRVAIPHRLFLPKKLEQKISLYGISNLTHCSNGAVHVWSVVKGNAVCKLCGIYLRDIEYDETQSKHIKGLSKNMELNAHAQKICQTDGRPHIYLYKQDTKTNVCVKCNKSDTHVYSSQELTVIEKQLIENYAFKQKRFYENQKLIENDAIAVNKHILEKINTTESLIPLSPDSLYEHITTFVNTIHKLIGNDAGNLLTNIYIIDHDHNGHSLDSKNLIISDPHKIQYKQQHPYFKTNVIYYTDKTTSRIDVFYDAISKVLLGYKEASKDFVHVQSSNKYLKINYSLYNKLKLMGYSGEYIDIENDYPDITQKHTNKDGLLSHADILKEIFKDRATNLKKFIIEFLKILNRIIHDNQTVHKNKKQSTDTTVGSSSAEEFIDEKNIIYFSKKIDSLTDTFGPKLSDLTLKTKQGNLFLDWNLLFSNVKKKTIDVKLNSAIYDVDVIDKFDETGQIVLHYITTQIIQLIEHTSGYTKTYLAQFVVDFINRLFSMFNTSIYNENADLRRFKMMLKSAKFAEEIPVIETSGIYDEYVDTDAKPSIEEIEAATDLKEEAQATDIDTAFEDLEETGESAYDHEQDLEPVASNEYS